MINLSSTQHPEPPVLLATTPDFSVWYKPPLILSQGSNFGDHLSLLRIAEKTLKPKDGPYLVHRLDREASGLMLLAHSKKSAASLSGQFQNHKVKKIYKTRVYGLLSKVKAPLEIRDPIDGKPALSIVTVVANNFDRNTTDLIVEIKTGRYHQIRRHLSMIGHPVCNDCRYGKKKKYPGSASFMRD